MNIVLTTKCSKNCNFCFSQGTHNLQYTEMYIDDFEFLLKNSNQHISILGGEPSESKNIQEALSICSKYNKKVSFISNLLFDDDFCDFLITKIKSRTINSILANASYLDIHNRFEIFVKNYKKLLDAYEFYFYKTPLKKITVGFTIEPHINIDYVEHLKLLINRIRFKRLRISLDYPSDRKKKSANKYINDKETGNILYDLWKITENNDITFAGDCLFYPCMFGDKYDEFKRADNTDYFTICKNCAADVNPDMTIGYCYPLKEKISLDLKNTPIEKINEDNIIRYLEQKYDEMFSVDIVPEKCRQCKYFISQECEGPCLGLIL